MYSVAVSSQAVDRRGRWSTVSHSILLMLGPASNGLVSTTWGLSGVTEIDRPVLGFAPVALYSCHIVTSANGSP